MLGRREGVARPELQDLTWRVRFGGGGGSLVIGPVSWVLCTPQDQLRFLKRQLVLPVSMMSQ